MKELMAKLVGAAERQHQTQLLVILLKQKINLNMN
jgi:hypothetical protein